MQGCRKQGGPGGHVFGRSVNLISTGGAHYAYHITTRPPPDFQALQWPCNELHNLLDSSSEYVMILFLSCWRQQQKLILQLLTKQGTRFNFSLLI